MPSPQVPFNDLSRPEPAIADEARAAVERVIASGRFVLGPEVEQFESEFSSFCGCRHSVAVGNGTDALELALRAVGVGPGARVGTVANAGMFTTVATLATGATPVYIDVGLQDRNLAVELLGDGLLAGLDALVVTHLYGRMAGMPEICARAAAFGVPVIEDCAQAHGARLDGRPAGSWGTAGCFSFYPTKNLGAFGDAGAVVTSDEDVAGRVRSLRQYGWSERNVASARGGRNSRMDEIQAAVLRVRLRELDRWNEVRRGIGQAYDAVLGSGGLWRGDPPAGPGSDVTHLYVVATDDRDGLVERLSQAGIGTQVHFPLPDHKQAAAAGLFAPGPLLPNTERLCRTVLSLPCFPGMTDEEIGRVAAALENEV